MHTSGPMFEQSRSGMEKVLTSDRSGAHYSVWHFDSNNGRADAAVGMDSLRAMFPSAEANDMNFVLFSTSGVHGSYITIEEVERGLSTFGEDYDPGDEEWPDDWVGRDITALIVHPRIVCVRCGNVRVANMDDIEFLKKLRQSSWDAMAEIGKGA